MQNDLNNIKQQVLNMVNAKNINLSENDIEFISKQIQEDFIKNFKNKELELQNIRIKEIASIEGSKAFQRLGEKTQVMGPAVGRPDIVNDRKSHTYNVKTSTEQMAINLAKRFNVGQYDIDYNYSLLQIAYCHDLGHPCLGHDGQKIINQFFILKGLKEGFDDNNNNLVIIKAQNIELRDCVLAGIIKYPHKMYDYQKEIYLPILEKQIEEDRIHFEKTIGIKLKPQKTTIACQIMDEADRNTYTCDDMADYFCLGNKIELKEALKFVDKNNTLHVSLIHEMVNSIHSKTKIRRFFNNLKEQFNDNFDITEDGVTPIDHNLLQFRETLSKMTFELYIKPIRADKFHLDNIKRLEIFLNHCIEGLYTESNFYNKKLETTKDPMERLRATRDMCAEISDTFLVTYLDKIFEEYKKDITQDKNKKLKVAN